MNEKLESKIYILLSKPDAETIHDIRTTSRRIQAYTDLLPKSVRRKSKVALYLTRVRTLFKATSPIRDLDIIQEKLKKFETDPEVKLILDQQKTREDLLAVAIKIASTLKKAGAPRVKVGEIPQSRLSKRKRKILRKYESLLTRQIKVENPTIEHLHDLRKNCKMLRYTLEVDSKRVQLRPFLVKIQGDLGVIMDVQTTLTALSKLSSAISAAITADIEVEKDNATRNFVANKPKLLSQLARMSSKNS